VTHAFADEPTEALWLGRRPSELPSTIHKVALRKLTQLEAASNLSELKGNRVGQYSIRVNDQYRVCFRWNGQNAEAVEITGYH